MALLLVFLLLLVGLFALFLGGGIVAQGYLYQNPAARLPLRALAAAALVAGFMALWMLIDQRSPGRYDTFFNFSPHTTVEIQEFEAVRWTGAGGKLKLDEKGNPTEAVAKFKRAPGGKSAAFVEDGSGDPFRRNGTTSGGAQYMTGAIRVKGPGDADWVRYNATLKEDPRSKEKTYTPEPRFVEEKGSRYVEVGQPGTLFVPSTGTVVISLLLNFALLAVWVVAFWPVMRFGLGHAVLFGGSLAIITMLAVMPLLFSRNRMPPKAPAPAATAIRSPETGARSPSQG